MPRPNLILATLASVVCITAASHGEPGLILRLGDKDARVARQVALFVPDGQAASAYAAPGSVVASFSGALNLEARSRLIFTLEGSGEATLSVDGELLCDALGKPSERKRLSSGAHALKVEYTGPAAGAAQLRLFWESSDFGKEPVPATAFSHDPADALLTKQQQLRLGHQLIAERRCNSCHGDTGNGGTPSLEGIGARIETHWLAHWIADPKAHRAAARMPKLFAADDALQKAADIAYFLAPPDKAPPARAFPLDPEMAKRGGHLFYEQGCIGCHTLDRSGDAERIGLAAVAQKFRPFALAAFLQQPNRHHAETRMPQFGFSEAEGNALEAFLRTLNKEQPLDVPEGDPERGDLLFHFSGCANCHVGVPESEGLPPREALPKPSAAICAAANFSLSETEQAAINAALAAPEPNHVPAEFADHQFAALRCAACHSRDGQPAWREAFAAEVAHLKPPEPPVEEAKPGAHRAEIPPLDHLGFKLRPAWRERLFKGEIAPKTRHWLKARMPAFPSRAAELTAGFSHAAGLPAAEPEPAAAEPAAIKAGAELVGVTGFTCVACHALGDQRALAVFEGEGPNFRDSGARLRGEYFHLWMNDPLRQWPGTIMPKYAVDGQTPLTQYYDGDASKQFEAIHQFLRSASE